MAHRLLVITLSRTPERLRAFYKNNKNVLVDWNVEEIDGIDGHKQEELNQKSRWISASAKEHWTKGAIGSALSHIKAWRKCIELNREVLVVEDDAILANNLKSKLEKLKIIGRATNQSNLVLLGWNTDSLLQAELSPGLEMISLFEPIYPELEQIKGIINSDRRRYLCNLNACFGLPAYWINPKAAHELIDACMPLRTEINNMTRGIPKHILVTLDGILSNRYKDMNAKILIPPIALALNNQQTSLTKRQTIRNFQG